MNGFRPIREDQDGSKKALVRSEGSNGMHEKQAPGLDNIRRFIERQPLLEKQLSIQGMEGVKLSPGSGIYLGTGICSHIEMSQGTPFDILTMVLSAASVRRKLGLGDIYHNVADTHALSNNFPPAQVEQVSRQYVALVETVAKGLNIGNYHVLRASSFNQAGDYREILAGIEGNAELRGLHSYARQELTDIEYFRRKGMGLKIGWTMGISDSEYDESFYDRNYRKYVSGDVGFLYIVPGRSFDKKKPRVAPYVDFSPDKRIMIPDSSVSLKIDAAVSELGSALNGARGYYNDTFRLWREFDPDMPKNAPFAEKITYILEKLRSFGLEERFREIGVGGSQAPKHIEHHQAREGKEQSLPTYADLLSSLDAATQAKAAVVLKNTAEVLTPEELVELLGSGKRLSAYYGIATTGSVHVGYLIPLSKAYDLSTLGIRTKILLADVHSVLDDQKTKFDEMELKSQYYRKCIELAVPWKEPPEFIRGSEFQLREDYARDLFRLASTTTVSRAMRAASEVTRMKDPKVSELMYPLLQVLDEQYLDIDIQLGGLDQRHIMALARESMKQLGYRRRVEVMTPLLLSLHGQGKKMSASDPGSAIRVYDSEQSIRNKVDRAFCPLDNVNENPVLQLARFMVFGMGANLELNLPDKRRIEIREYEELERRFSAREIHPADLKVAIADSLVLRLARAREYFESNQDLLRRLGEKYAPSG
jgi:tyrosyl-tRNA synthetase